MSKQTFPAPSGELPIRGGRALARVAYGADGKKEVRRLYNEAPSLPLFRTKPKGPLQGYPSKIRAHYAALSAEAEAKAMATSTGEIRREREPV